MAYAFRIHEPKTPGATAPMQASTMSGWTQTGHIAGNLLSNIPMGLAGNKMGTSIPTLFARLFLFEGAFQALRGKTVGELQQISTDTKLISECLDLLEFLFQYGKDSRLVVKKWDAHRQIESLSHSTYEEHQKFATVLRDEIALHPNLNQIYLFYWKAATSQSLTPVETLIGGTSPYTLVFTSPNWKKEMMRKGFTFNRTNGTPLFSDNNIQALNQRSSDFKDMLYGLNMAYNANLNAQAVCFADYLSTMWSNDVHNPEIAAMAANPGAFMDEFSFVKDTDGGNVSSLNIPICYNLIVPNQSGYEIKATSSRYKHYVAKDGSNIELETPLALNKNGLGPSVNYVGNSTWNNNCIINEAATRNEEMHKRTLPGGMGVVHPYIIWSDFLEDKIIKLPYSQDSDKFVTVSNGEAKYLLPLKRDFFRYFNISDVSSTVPGTTRKFVDMQINGDKVKVTINVPITDTAFKTIPLEKEYSGDDIVDKTHVLLGFFPFYRIPEDNKNRYNVMLCGNDSFLSFYNLNDISKPINITSKVRSKKGVITSQTEYYLIKNAFDFVEVNVNGCSGIVIPKMKDIQAPGNKYKFAIDFGTSNTYIAHSTTQEPASQTLEIDGHDQQAIFLTNEVDKGQRLNLMKPIISREFVPTELNRNSVASFPCRTAVCEIPEFENQVPELFSNINIGFNMMSEQQATGTFTYKTGLKWLLEQKPGHSGHTNRIKFFFLQTLWMLKNESYMNDGDDTFDVYITFPETMKVPTQNSLVNLWNWAKQELQLACNFFYGTQFSESIAPYNCMAHLIGGSSYMNVDIGGGTNDLLFVLKNQAGHIESAKYSSSMFAGDDLWGDGIVINNNAQSRNGFVNYITIADGTEQQPKGILENTAIFPPEVVSPLNSLLGGVASSSSDIMGYLFKYDNVFSTTGKIQGNQSLYTLVFIHYAAILNNIARLINKMNIEIPEKLSFTGMGSKYVKLISSNDNVLKELTVLLLEKYSGKKTPKTFSIISNTKVDVKEITAKGVLEGLGLNPGFAIPAGSISPVIDYGFEYEKPLTYGEVEKDEIRNAAIESFKKFVESFRDADLKNFLFQRFNLTISDALLNDLILKGEQSFATMSASVPPEHKELQITETLFFWPLKNALVEVSRNYAAY